MVCLKVKEVNPKSSHHKEKKNIFFFFVLKNLYKMMNINQIYCDYCDNDYCGNHFTIYASPVIMLYPLSLYGAVYQLYLNKTGNK